MVNSTSEEWSRSAISRADCRRFRRFRHICEDRSEGYARKIRSGSPLGNRVARIRSRYDPYLRGFLHASPDTVGMQGFHVLHVPIRGVTGGGPRCREERADADPPLRCLPSDSGPCIRNPGARCTPNPPSDDTVKLIFPALLADDQPAGNEKHASPAIRHRGSELVAVLEESTENTAALSVHQVVPQQAQIDLRGEHLRCVREVGDPAAVVGLVGAQKDLHPEFPVRPHVECGLQQAANRPGRFLPVVGARR